MNVERSALELEVEAPQDTIVDEDHLVFIGVPEAKLEAAQIAVEACLGRFKLPSGLSRFPLAFQVFGAMNPGSEAAPPPVGASAS